MNIVITGGTKGIGRAIAEAFVLEGFKVAIGARNIIELEGAQAELQEQFPKSKVFIHQLDCADKKNVFDFAAWAEKELGTIDVLVNNAGSFIPSAMMVEKDGNIEQMLAINALAPYYLCRSLAVGMMKKKKGHIFNICSISGKRAIAGSGSYSVSKFANYGFTMALREELQDYGIKVTAIIPGATRTESWDGTKLPDSRFVSPADVASAIMNAWKMSKGANVDEITIRPALGEI